MVKKKDFTTGLDRLIQKTTVSEETVVMETEPSPEPEKKEKERQITITIPPSLKRTIKKYCANNDITIKELFINSVNTYMKAEEV